MNGEPVSFSLEKENSLAEIYTALSGWAGGQGASLAGFEVDGAAMDLSRSGDWGARPLDGVKKICIQAVATQKAEGLGIIRDYFELFGKALESGNDETLRELLAEYPYIRRGLEVYIRDLFVPGEVSGAEELVLALREKSSFSAEEKKALSSYVQAAGRIASDRLSEVFDPGKQAAATARLLIAAKPTLENVPVLLQSGKDGEAMQNILSYTELALKAIRLLAGRNSSEKSSGDFCREFNGILCELASAFEVRDSVLVGDLFEYEIAPRTDRLVELLDGGCA